MIVETFLAKHLETDENNVKNLIKSANAVKFMLVWSMFEAICFDGFMKKSKIDAFARRIEKLNKSIVSEENIRHFHERYQDDDKWKNLIHSDNANEYRSIKRKGIEDLSDQEKIKFTIYVIYRYRNNIFHGSKGIDSWLKYQDQIKICNEIMMNLVDEFKV